MSNARKNGLFSFLTDKKETYRRSAAGERRDMAAAAKRDSVRARRDEVEQKRLDRKTALDNFMGVKRWKLGTGEIVTAIDSSRFESVKDANDFIRSVKSNPRGRGNITDRAQRYRAHAAENVPPDPKHCFCCGASTEMVGHIDNDESNTVRENLAWCCRSCNTKLANALHAAGIGRLTAQYNPAGGARNIGQWMNAVMSMKGESDNMSVSDAVAMIHATSPAKRSEFGREIWSRRRRYGSARAENPADLGDDTPEAAAELSEVWHGRPDNVTRDEVEKVRYRGNLTGLGRLFSLNVLVGLKSCRPVKFDKNTMLSSAPNGEQLYVIGGDQKIDLEAHGITGHAAKKDLLPLGKCYSVVYCTAKHHLNPEDKQYGAYEHILLSEADTAEVKKTGRITPAMRDKFPDLVYDTLNDRVGFSGGHYHIDRDMDFRRYSAGLRD